MKTEFSLFGWTIPFIPPLHSIQDRTRFHFIAEDSPVIQHWIWRTLICWGSCVSIGIIRSYWPLCSPITSLELEEDSLARFSRKPLRPQCVCVRENTACSTGEMFHYCHIHCYFLHDRHWTTTGICHVVMCSYD